MASYFRIISNLLKIGKRVYMNIKNLFPNKIYPFSKIYIIIIYIIILKLITMLKLIQHQNTRFENHAP